MVFSRAANLPLPAILSVLHAGRWSVHTVTERRARALEAALRTGHAKAVTLLNELKEKEKAMLSDFQNVAGIKLDAVSGQFSSPSPEVDTVLRAEPTVREAWAAVLNARIPPDKWRAATTAETEIAARLERALFQREDRSALEEMTSWAEASFSAIEAQDANVKHIRSMLDAAKWHVSQSERSAP